MKAQGRLVSSEAPLLGLQMVCVVSVCLLTSSSYKDMSPSGVGSALMNSFSLNYPFKDLLSKYSHILTYWELEFQHRNGVGR